MTIDAMEGLAASSKAANQSTCQMTDDESDFDRIVPSQPWSPHKAEEHFKLLEGLCYALHAYMESGDGESEHESALAMHIGLQAFEGRRAMKATIEAREDSKGVGSG